ncbi:MAG TPA: TetR/AcrR family transcriptional regulator [Actinomycetospora sp.]|jgi:AcrR family transcriptional regulator|uniref:TetR/AcrR family transcriptional regulator n=1 Tax=Actinomycetospora sp. TaxID=1872135 RepID=UPI002F40750C
MTTDAAPGETDPLWAPPSAPRRERRPLSREAIVGAAVALADAEGIEAVSMPRLARTLGAAPMSLYRHVPHKEALLALMVDAAVGPPPDVAAETVREGMARWARANRGVFAAHPWTLPLVTGPQRMGPSECAWAEVFLTLLDEVAGMPAEQAIALVHVVNAYVRGASAPIGNRAPTAAEVRSAGREDELPRLLTLLPSDADTRGAQGPDDELFELGLAAVVDGCVRQAGIDPS